MPIRRGGMNQPVKATGLKISFNPGQLAQTTDKRVSAQIKAVLQKQNAKKSNVFIPPPPALKENTTRRVIVAGSGNNNNNSGGRGGGGGRGGRGNRGRGGIRK
mmetsp:Transcript_30298/g.30783  ORF Transcript_30298/g.30783 Transcript_30298/m.30783 type:complete len:103 (-) Transcript_30298:240-548(-)